MLYMSCPINYIILSIFNRLVYDKVKCKLLTSIKMNYND